MRICCHLVIISKLKHCCEYTTVVNSGILIHKKDVDDHKVTVANLQRVCIKIICIMFPSLFYIDNEY